MVAPFEFSRRGYVVRLKRARNGSEWNYKITLDGVTVRDIDNACYRLQRQAIESAIDWIDQQ